MYLSLGTVHIQVRGVDANSPGALIIGGGTGGGARGASGPSTFQTGGAWPLHFLTILF